MFMRLLARFESLLNMIRNFAIAAFSGLSIFTIAPTSIISNTNYPQSATWQIPFESPHRLIRQYVQPNSDYSAGHRGVDYAVSLDDVILAPSDGVISYSANLVNRSVLAISHPGGFKSEFEPACSSHAIGDYVSAGEPVGTVCEAGATYVQHCPEIDCLHFSLRLNGQYLSPLSLIGGLNPSRLLPLTKLD